jgi:hypothetical protein
VMDFPPITGSPVMEPKPRLPPCPGLLLFVSMQKGAGSKPTPFIRIPRTYWHFLIPAIAVFALFFVV